MGASPGEHVEPARGTVLCGKYRVERSLGRGGMGAVMLATHLTLDCPVAIKLVPAQGPTDYLAARFLREARAMARLSSDHVVRVLDLDRTADGAPVLVMEFLEGVDLERRLAQGVVTPGEAVDWALQACAALAEAHARGIVHRDVKPANLFLVQRLDGREQLKLLDFGISKLSGDDLRLTRTATGLGSPLFMSPEQLLTPSDVDARTDVWSLGVTIFRLLSNTAPYTASDASTLAAQIAARAPTDLREVAPSVAPALAAVVMRCLEKDVTARWPTVVALAEALAPFAPAGSVGSLAEVKQSEVHGRRLGAVPAAPEPAPVTHAAGPRTLSHDVPRVEVPAVVSAAPPVSTWGSAPHASRPPVARWVGAAAVVALVIGAALWKLLPAAEPARVSPPPVAPLAREVPAVAPTTPAPPEPVAPPSVITLPGDRARPASKSEKDKKGPRPTGTGDRDPADLEIKE